MLFRSNLFSSKSSAKPLTTDLTDDTTQPKIQMPSSPTSVTQYSNTHILLMNIRFEIFNLILMKSNSTNLKKKKIINYLFTSISFSISNIVIFFGSIYVFNSEHCKLNF